MRVNEYTRRRIYARAGGGAVRWTGGRQRKGGSRASAWALPASPAPPDISPVLLPIPTLHLLIAPAVCPSGCPAVRPSDTAHVVVVATTDVHGHATDWDYIANQPSSG